MKKANVTMEAFRKLAEKEGHKFEEFDKEVVELIIGIVNHFYNMGYDDGLADVCQDRKVEGGRTNEMRTEGLCSKQ